MVASNAVPRHDRRGGDAGQQMFYRVCEKDIHTISAIEIEGLGRWLTITI